ncbi:MAG: sulfotransferase [Gammaproteobacteria bacterium]
MMDDYTLPVDSPTRFEGRVVLLTGVGRSGTSILGKLIGSMDRTYYLFEPAVMKLLPALCVLDSDRKAVYGSALRALLFEDYVLQVVHGRALNFNRQDDSCVEHYMLRSDIEARWSTLRRRDDAIAYLDRQDARYVIKTPEFQPLSEILEDAFPDMKLIHITRNGNDVVSSAVARGWYSDTYMNENIVDWVRKGDQGGCNVPWYLDEESQAHFGGWNVETRAAAVWRCLTDHGIRHSEARPGQSMEVSYEELVRDPDGTTSRTADYLGRMPTDLTRKHIKAIKAFEINRYPSVEHKLQEPERGKYVALMRQLGYMASERG